MPTLAFGALAEMFEDTLNDDTLNGQAASYPILWVPCLSLSIHQRSLNHTPPHLLFLEVMLT